MLTVKDLSKLYKDDLSRTQKIVLEGLNLSFPKGKTTALMGHNGAGKTTLIRLILGLAFPSQGSIHLEGRPITRQDRIRLGYLPETDHISLTLTPREILTYHLKLFRPLHPSPKQVIEKFLEKTGISPHADRRSNFLSKGQRRRIAWSQAIIHDPDIIILDEPFSGLDPQGRADMASWILEARKQSKTIILCTHDIRVTHHLADQIIILKSGKCVWESKDENLENFRLEIENTLPDGLEPPISHTHNGNIHVYTWNQSQHALDALLSCHKMDIRILSFTTERLPNDLRQKDFFVPTEPSL